MHELHAIEEFYHSRKLPEKGFSSRLKSKDKNEQARVGIGKLSTKRSGKPKGECYKCGQKGHWKKDCPKIIKIRADNNEADNGNEELHYGYAGFANELDEFEDDYEYEAAVDGSYPDNSDSSHLFGSESDSDRDLDDYESGDDSGDDSEDDFEEQACIRYEKNAGGFEFNSVGDEIVLRPGQLFVSVYELRKVLKVFAIRNGFRLKRLKNEKTRVTCVCAAAGCTWRIHASLNWNKKSFQIKTHCPDHTCPRVDDNFEASSNWIAATYLHLFKANPDIKISVIAAGLMQKYGIECNNQRLYRAKRKAFELLGQDHKASYSKLFRYMHALLNSNPGSTVSLERDWFGGAEFPIFKRFFICFDSSRRGFFEGCRPMIGVDGCHLKGPYRGVLLTAVSIDANYGIYPLAMCVAENENNDSWQYFMDKLYDQVGCNGGEGLCFISDRQKGVLNALDRIFPLSLKRYCCRHIYANFKQKFPGLLLKKVFWRACRSSNVADFNSHMEELKTISPEGYEWLMKIPTVCWAKHLFPPHTKCSHVTNNMTESFNNWINNFRGLLIVRMFEEIRRKTMRLIHRRHEAALGWNNELPPVVRRKIIKGREEARSLSVIFGHNETFEILEDVTKIVVVDLLKRKCDCSEWAISGMPCKHALCCIDAKRYNVEDYVHPFLKKAAYIAAYKHQIIPVPDEKRWPLVLHDNLQPPAIIRSVGRPQTKRRREAGESSTFKQSSSVRCSRCDHWGHNKRTCPRAINDQMRKDKALVSDTSSQHVDIQISQTQSSAQNNGN
ncbi:uncharacterized protein LOC107177123 [Citrus sinensis]|uniref:uncharacterized protein LOC107177123 n=1 Tax=Citrus sinensis TaxID=2711 RepID=UPI0022798C42|nr:uncharacterized protein LOC107177123 [Citrus sinensis]